jgi:hypothetical protein
MKIYIDHDFCCHTTNPNGNFREIQTDFFDGKCAAFIEGYRYVPSGESWTRSDGMIFRGETITPFKPYSELYADQLEHERSLLVEYSSALSEIEVAISAPGVSGTVATIVENRKRNIETRINEIIEILTAASAT